ncbi:ferredoxin [Flavonifractor hominis]|uniref:Ferredoxin n=1 Tax=Flavonifractor hominis TaxID=3133178 RepID=A0ABV1EMX3_9FIRM
MFRKERGNMEVTIDRARCIGCGLCVSACPDVFHLAEDALAQVHRQPGPAHLPAVRAAAESCPVGIIHLDA